jgi:hypothetical protein
MDEEEIERHIRKMYACSATEGRKNAPQLPQNHAAQRIDRVFDAHFAFSSLTEVEYLLIMLDSYVPFDKVSMWSGFEPTMAAPAAPTPGIYACCSPSLPPSTFPFAVSCS